MKININISLFLNFIVDIILLTKNEYCIIQLKNNEDNKLSNNLICTFL